MEIGIDIGTRHEFMLKKILLYYGGKSAGREAGFVTEHDPVMADGELGLSAGKLLTKDFLRSLASSLNQVMGIEYLPPHILGRTPEAIAWWTPPRQRAMFFGKEEMASISGKVFPQPALLWVVESNHLCVRALGVSERPAADSPVFVAPYWNTEPHRGSVCTGSMTRPATTTPSTLEVWEQGFFDSKFTHASGGGVLTRHKGGYQGLWHDLADKDVFPFEYLQPTKDTVGSYIGGKGDDSQD